MQSKRSTCGDANLTSTPSNRSQIESTQQIAKFSGRETIASCPTCSSVRVNLVRSSASPPYAALRAGRDAFRRWAAKRSNRQKWRWQQTRIAILLKLPQLSQWEQKFLASVQSKQSLLPKQREVLAQIAAKVGGQE